MLVIQPLIEAYLAGFAPCAATSSSWSLGPREWRHMDLKLAVTRGSVCAEQGKMSMGQGVKSLACLPLQKATLNSMLSDDLNA